VSSALGALALPLPTIALGISPSANAVNTHVVSQIGISSQRHLNISSNNDSLARMKLKNSMLEVLGLKKHQKNEVAGPEKPSEKTNVPTVPNRTDTQKVTEKPEEEENKNSDIYNADAGSYFNQKCLIGV